MKKKVALLAIASLAISACSGGNEREVSRNVVFTPTVAGGPTPATLGEITDLEFDTKSESVYAASSFSEFGVREGLLATGGTILDTSDPNNLEPAKRFPATTGQVIEAVVPDGTGGWYVAGTRDPDKWGLRNIVRINADGSLNEQFDPKIITSDTFSKKEIILFEQHPTDSTSLVLVAKVAKSGNFDFASESQQCARVFIINKTTGDIVKRIDLDGSCPDIATLWRNHLVFAGQFDTVLGQPRNKIAAINLSTKAVVSVGSNFGTAFPAFDNGENGKQIISDLRVDSDTLFVAGLLGVGGQHVAAIDLLRGSVNSWNPAGRLTTTLHSSQLSSHRLMVTEKAVVVAGCLGGLGSSNFVAYDRITGAVRPFETQMVLMRDYCSSLSSGWTITSFGTSMIITGVASVRGQSVPGYAWIDESGALTSQKLSLEPIPAWFAANQKPDVFQYFPSINRMFVGVRQSLLNRRNLGQYLSADSRGNTKVAELLDAVDNWQPLMSAVKDGNLYIAGTVQAGNQQRKVVHRFDAATGRRDTSFEIDYSGFSMTSIKIAATVVALIDGNSSDNQLRIYSRDTGRFVGSFPDDYANSTTGKIFNGTTVGDVLYTNIEVSVTNGIRWQPARIDLKTGSTVVYNVNLGAFLAPCDCPPFIDGERLFVYREVNGEIETIVIDIKSGTVERRFTNWALFGGWNPIRFGDELVVPQITDNGLELVVLNERTLEPSKTLVLAQNVSLPSSIGGITASADRLYIWINGQAESSDGRILTGLIAFNKQGAIDSSSQPQLGGDSAVSINPIFVGTPNPGTQDALRQNEAAAGQVTIRGIEQGNRSLTVHFSSNGNQGPFEVRQVGGNKVCSTSATSCTFTKLTAYNSYSFVVEAKDRMVTSLSSPTAPTKPIVALKKGKTLRLSTVIKPSTKASVKWKVSKACKLNASKTILTAPKKATRCTVTVSSKKGKKTIKRSISIAVA